MEPTIYPPHTHPITRQSIDPDALRIMHRLSDHGFTALLVGGGVRDLLVGKKPKDFDIATNATPRQVKSLFYNARIIGRRFKLVHIFFPGGKNIEVATFRASNDQEPDNGEEKLIKDDNTFGTQETDAVRRDITINALYYDAISGSIIDYVGGYEDVKDKLVRVIGVPDVRFAEDPVRLIRVVRHAARNNFRIEDRARTSLWKNRELLKQCSKVRVFEEIRKDITSGSFLAVLKGLYECSLLSELLPEISSELLLHTHPCADCLERIDELYRAGESLPLTLTLGVLAIFSKNPFHTEDIASFFPTSEELETHITTIFTHIAVPRRERETLEYTLKLWQIAYSETQEETQFVRKYIPYAEHVLHLMRVLPESRHDKRAYQFLKELQELPLERTRTRRRRRRHKTQ